MNPIYERTNTATTFYPEEQTTTVLHDGHRYKLMGESAGQELSLSQRAKHVVTIIAFVVAAIFTSGFIFIGLIFPTFRDMIIRPFNELRSGTQTNLHYVLENPQQLPRDTLDPFIEKLTDHILDNQLIPAQLTSASCCISINYNHGESNADEIPFEQRSKIKKQFLFKNDSDTPFTKAELIQKIESMKKELKTSIETEIDVATTKLYFGCILLYQDSPLNLVQASYVSPDTHCTRCEVEKGLKWVYVDRKEVLSEDGKRILAGPNTQMQ